MKKTMKLLSLTLILLTSLFTQVFAQTDADAILGRWTNEDNTRVIEFVKTGNGYNAVIKEAPDKSVIGKNQLTGVVFSNGNYNGNVHLPKKGKSYPCTIKIKSDGTMELTAKAGFMSKTQSWVRVQ